MSEPLVERHGNRVQVAVGSSHEEIDPETWTPAEARAFAARIVAVADETESAERAVRELCQRQGHDWIDEGYDAYATVARTAKVHIRWCVRDGCDARREEPGWRGEYPPKRHIRPVGLHGVEVECCGPGCPDCDAEQLGAALRPLLADAAARLEAILDVP